MKNLAICVATACAARRKGAVWYVSGIASWEGASVEADLSFLGPGEWTAEIFEDGVNVDACESRTLGNTKK